MLKILFMVIALVLLALPFLPLKIPCTFYWFNFPEEKRPKNIYFIISTAVVILLTLVFMPYVLKFAAWFNGLKFINWLINLVPNYAQYSSLVFGAIFVNILFCAIVLLVHWITGAALGLFPKFSPKSLKKIIADAKERRRLKKEQRNKQNKEGEKDQTKQNETDPDKKDQDQESEKDEIVKDGQNDENQVKTDLTTIPKHLLPNPQSKDQSGLVTLFGKKAEEKVTRNSNQNSLEEPAKETKDDSDDFSAKKTLLELLSFFYVREGDIWYVQPQCKKVAKHLRNFLMLIGTAYLIIFALLMIPIFFAVKDYATEFYNLMSLLVDNCYLYPAVSLVLLTEIFWFMNGRLAEEPIATYSYKTDKQTSRVVDLDAIECQLMENFGSEYEIKTFYSDDVEGQERSRFPIDISDDYILQNVLAFVESQKMVRNDDYLRGIEMLERGMNTLFDAPLYTAVSIYLYPYLNMRISQGERLLVVCQDYEKINEIIENLREGFKRVQRAHTCQWSIANRKELSPDNETDVLIVTPQDFLDDQFFTEAEDFLQRTTIALFPDADQVVMSNNYLCVIIAERLRQATGNKIETRFQNDETRNVQYIFLSTRHTLNLVRSLKEYFLLGENVYNVQAEYAYGSVRLYVWRAIDEARIMLDNSAQTVRLETAISNIARKFGVPNVTMFTKGAIFPNQIDFAWLETYDVFDRPIGFTVVSDESYNLPGTIYTYSRYLGKEASVLHVISKPYMLRDYFYDSAIRSLYERPLMERGMTEHAQITQTSTVLLLCKLMKGIPVTEFSAKMQEITGTAIDSELTYPEIKKLVDTCLTIAFGRNATAEDYGFSLINKFDSSFKQVKYIQIRESGILDHLMKDTQLVTVHIGQSTTVIPLFKRMLAQKHLVGQHMVIDHASYKITGIDYEKGKIIATPATSVHNVPDQYIQVREYTLKEECEQFIDYCRKIAEGEYCDAPVSISGTQSRIEGKSEIKSVTMVRSIGGMTIDSHTVAFYDSTKCPGQLDLMNSSVFYVKTDLHRDVNNAMYLRFEGEFAGNDRLTMTLAILLQEMMKTMFPDQHFCISVCPILKNPDSIYNDSDDHCQRIAKMYPKVHGWGECASNAIELLIVDDCEGGTGVLDILYDPEAVYLYNILDMLSDYLGWLEKHPEDKYLYFGADECPEIYELGRVHDLISVFSKSYIRENDLFKSLHMSNCCKFCGETLVAEQTYLWNNRYNICAQCYSEYRPDEKEIALILESILDYLDKSFGAEIKGEITVTQTKEVDLSALDVEAKTIRLNADLPLTAVHSEIVRQLVRLWQFENLFITGEPEFDGQLLFVLIQYLDRLEQYKRCKRLHSHALLGSDDSSVGYCRLRQALQALSNDNSFKYMLDSFGKNGRTPIVKTDPKRSTRKPDNKKSRYIISNSLSENEKGAYDRIVKGIMEMETEIDIGEFNIPKEDINRIWRSVMNDHPELYGVNFDEYSYSNTGGSYDYIEKLMLSYTMERAERDQRQREIDEALPQFLENIYDDTGDFETALQVYINLSKQLDYDSLELERQERRKEALRKSGISDNETDDLRSIYGALVLRRSVCAGYARAYQYILQKLGMESVYVAGECTDGERHAWNIINMEGNYYHVDVTWGDGSNTDPDKNREFVSFGYFGLTDKEIRMSRTIDDCPEVPICTENHCNYFVRNGLFFKAYDHILVKKKLTEFLGEPERERVDLRFSNASVLSAAQQQLLENGGIYEILTATGRKSAYRYYTDSKLNILTVFFEPASPEKPEI